MMKRGASTIYPCWGEGAAPLEWVAPLLEQRGIRVEEGGVALGGDADCSYGV